MTTLKHSLTLAATLALAAIIAAFVDPSADAGWWLFIAAVAVCAVGVTWAEVTA